MFLIDEKPTIIVVLLTILEIKNNIMMKKKKSLLIICLAIIISSCSDNKNLKSPETEIEEVSYSLGVNVATGVKAQGLEIIDTDQITSAFNDVFEENELKISEEESIKILQDYFTKLQQEKQSKANEEGAKYLEENRKKEGVITTESGLQYEIIKSGNGENQNQLTRLQFIIMEP